MSFGLLAAVWCGWVAGCSLAIPPVLLLYGWAITRPDGTTLGGRR